LKNVEDKTPLAVLRFYQRFADRHTDRQTDGRMDGQMDGHAVITTSQSAQLHMQRRDIKRIAHLVWEAHACCSH